MMSRLLPLVLATSASSAALFAAPASTLKEAYAENFLIGAALHDGILTDADHPARALVLQHFGSVTGANAMKWGPFNPEPGVYVYEPADALVELAETHGMQVVGHTLFWHQQTPDWVFQDASGALISREALLARMRERVRLLSARYGARVHVWDVVNEAFNDDGSLRDSPWTRVLGADFVPEAFRMAAEELPPSVQLIYNDYSMFHRGRREAVVKMVHDLRARGIRIDGVGMQGHWGLEFPQLEEAEASIVAFAAAGVRVHITELDIEVLPRSPDMFGADISKRVERTPENDPYTDGLPAEGQERLARRYAEIFALFVKHADKIDRVTLWGVTDADSWLNNWPVPGRTNHPLLFDHTGRPKPAFEAVVRAAEGAEWETLFNGRDLSGWTVKHQPQDAGKGFWRADAGTILCDSLGHTGHDYIWLMTDREFGDFELRLKFQAYRDSPGNSGVQFRSRYDSAAEGGGWLDGPQVDIHPRPPQTWRTGLIYDETRGERRWVHPSLTDWRIDETHQVPGHVFRFADEGDGWNDLVIICRGTRVRTMVNGVAVSAWDGAGVLDNEAHLLRNVGLTGHIALQLHKGDQLRIRFKDIRIRELRD